MITRTDLPLGFMAAQIVHAAGETSSGALPPDTNAIVLGVPDEVSLLAVSARLQGAGIQHHVVREDDAPWSGQAMAIGIPPQPRACLKPHLSAIPLLREKGAS